jgi:hypothetical protein
MKTRNSILSIALVLPLLSGVARAQDAENPARASDSTAAGSQEEVRRALATTEQQLLRARQELERTRAELEQMRQRMPGAPQNPAPVAPRLTEMDIPNLLSRSPGSGAERPLILRTSDIGPGEQANLEEDLTVMTRLFQKAMSELPGRALARRETAMGIDVFVATGPGPERSYYLEGYGVLFLLDAGFPLMAPPTRTEAGKPSPSSPWEEARRELYGRPPQIPPPVRPGGEFTAEKVDRLKDTMLDILKNASNIRDMKPDEWVTVCVLGGGNSVPMPYGVSAGGGSTGYGGGFSGATTGTGFFSVGDRNPPPSRTVMTLRIKKTDADAFAKGDITREEFRSRARIATYASALVERAAPSPERTPQRAEYTVQPGDTLQTIISKIRSRNPSITPEKLMQANPGLNVNRLVPGMKLVIPSPVW